MLSNDPDPILEGSELNVFTYHGLCYQSSRSSFGRTTFERVVTHAIIIHVAYNGAQANELCNILKILVHALCAHLLYLSYPSWPDHSKLASTSSLIPTISR